MDAAGDGSDGRMPSSSEADRRSARWWRGRGELIRWSEDERWRMDGRTNGRANGTFTSSISCRGQNPFLYRKWAKKHGGIMCV